MFCKILLFAVFASSCIWAQLCIPNPLEFVQLENNTLSWSSSNNCPATQYIVIIKSGGVIEYEYTVDVLEFDVSFLKLCRNYNFVVQPSADHILGLEYTLDASIALPESTDIVVHNFTGAQIGDDVLIQWLVNETYGSCIGYFHVLSWHEDSDTPDSLYIGQTGYLVEHVAQCMNYKFEITAHYGGRNGTTQEFNYTVPEATNKPTLVEIRQDTSVINTTWSLEKFATNRCNVTALYVNGTHFNQTYEIVDTPDRPDVLVSITDLRADSMYFFNVSTENSAGISEAFQIAVQTLEIDPTEE